MKKTLSIQVVPAIVAAIIALSALSSCTTKKYYNVIEEHYDSGLTIDVQTYSVDKSHFTWSPSLGRFEYTFEDDEYLLLYLDNNQLQHLEIAGSILFKENGREYYSPLPFVDSYYYRFNSGLEVQVTQTIGFEATRGALTFFVQTNEPDATYDFIDDIIYFKVSFFYYIY